MLLYTHLCLAKVVLRAFRLDRSIIIDQESKADYYLGSILPDVRYFSKMGQPGRDRTHPRLSEFTQLAASCENRAFVFGYLVHLLADSSEPRILIPKGVQKRFWRLFRRRIGVTISPTLSEVLPELHYLNSFPPDFQISANANSLTERLGIRDTDIAVMKSYVDQFLEDISLKNISDILGDMKVAESEKIRHYLNLVSHLARYHMIRRVVLRASARTAHVLENRLVAGIRNSELSSFILTRAKHKSNVNS